MLSARDMFTAVTAVVCYCDKTCPLALALNFNLVHTFYKLFLYLLIMTQRWDRTSILTILRGDSR